jgi:AraC-like DNA-binding protein
MDSSIIINIILFVGAAQGLLLSIALITLKRGNRTANLMLASFIILFSVILFFHSLYEFNNPIQNNVQAENPVHDLFLAFGPLFYLYVVALTNKYFRFKLIDTLHFLPMSVALLIDFILKMLDIDPELQNSILPYTSALIIVQICIYLYLSINTLKKHSENLKKSISYIEKINLDWLKILIIAQLIIWPLALIIEIGFHNHKEWSLFWVLISILIYMMGYKGITQPEIFTGVLSLPEENDLKRKYEKSSLSPELAEKYFNDLKKIMETEKLYLDTNITLPSLAEKMSVSHHHLSQIINEKLNQNFFEFINSYRIEEAKQMLSNPEKQILNISVIAFDSGFNTLSSFNSVFKKFTSQTPSQFRSEHTN